MLEQKRRYWRERKHWSKGTDVSKRGNVGTEEWILAGKETLE
jgi:hypothetical protein